MLLSKLLFVFRVIPVQEKKFRKSVKRILGMTPVNLDLYHLALRHTSVANVTHVGNRESNERLEYLGDAILGAVVADYLFRKFPFREEGFLTEIRSRLVNRESLNQLARKIGLDKLIEFDGSHQNKHTYKSITGDALEALVGAVYLDKGFKKCRRFIIFKLIRPHFDLEEIIENNKNFKSLLIEWAQKESREVRFEIISEKGSKHRREFIAQVIIDGEPVTSGSGLSKKKAEQAAAEKCCEKLGLA